MNAQGPKSERSNHSVTLVRRANGVFTLFLLAFAFLLATSAAAAEAHTSLRVTIRVNSVVLLTVAGVSSAPIQGWGNSSASVSLPITYGKSTVTANADASGQPNNNGCTILARLSATTAAAVIVNDKLLSSDRAIIVAGTSTYPASATLAIEASTAQPSATLPSILLTCQPK